VQTSARSTPDGHERPGAGCVSRRFGWGIVIAQILGDEARQAARRGSRDPRTGAASGLFRNQGRRNRPSPRPAAGGRKRYAPGARFQVFEVRLPVVDTFRTLAKNPMRVVPVLVHYDGRPHPRCLGRAQEWCCRRQFFYSHLAAGISNASTGRLPTDIGVSRRRLCTMFARRAAGTEGGGI
jgi:hypothetical protein